MDQDEVIDMVFDLIEPVLQTFTGYKIKAKDGATGMHYVVNALPWAENLDWVNEGFVNVNLFVPLRDNGMIDNTSMKTAIRSIKPVLKAVGPEAGVYRKIEIVWTETVDIKTGFYCKNVRLLITTQK